MLEKDGDRGFVVKEGWWVAERSSGVVVGCGNCGNSLAQNTESHSVSLFQVVTYI